MFTREQLGQVDPAYFDVITLDDMDVTIRSKNTGHYWYMHCTDCPVDGSCVIFHKHQFRHPYHHHGWGKNLGHAVRLIRRHDEWQMKGRKR